MGEIPDFSQTTVISTGMSESEEANAMVGAGGAIAVIDVTESTVNDALTAPNLTSLTWGIPSLLKKYVPVIVTGAPPSAGPKFWVTLVMVVRGYRLHTAVAIPSASTAI